MAASYNKVLLMGNLTRDPELRTTASGLNICKFSLACNRSYKAQDGTPKEEVTYVEVDAFGRQAELISRSLTKGSPLFVEGRLKLDQWEDSKSGEKRSKLGVVLENFQFINAKRGQDDGAGSSSGYYSPPERSAATTHASSTPRAPAALQHNDIDEDVPF